MSFSFEWPRFSEQFHTDAIQMLNNALNKDNKPAVIADKIEVVELEMGTQPPELEIRDIGDLTVDHFRGIFRFTYSGDAHIVLKTKVQANPLNHKQPDIHILTGSRGMLAAKSPLVVPMLLRLSHFRLSSYVVLVVSKQKGITLVFKTDPLQNVDINSTFDSIAVIQNFIQREIEGQLRQMFREDLPGIIHRLSQQWVKAKVEAPYLEMRPSLTRRRAFDSMSAPPEHSYAPLSAGVGLNPHLHRQQSLNVGSTRSRSVSGISAASTSRKQLPTTHASTTAMPDPFSDSTEAYDPTYGLRPEGLPVKSVFASFGKLFSIHQNKGLADLVEEPDEQDVEEETYEDEGGESYWEDSTVDFASPPASVIDDGEHTPEYETIPAIGGGFVTRPRVYHSQAMIQPPSGITRHSSSSQHSSKSTSPAISCQSTMQSSLTFTPEQSYFDAYHPSVTPHLGGVSAISSLRLAPRSSQPPLHLQHMKYSQRTRSEPNFDMAASSTPYPYPRRPVTPDSLETQFSRSSSGGVTQSASIKTSSSSDIPPHSSPLFDTSTSSEAQTRSSPMPFSRRRSSMSSTESFHFFSGSPPNHLHHHMSEPDDPKIVLRPSINNIIHHLSTLSHSNHTLSPYTRSFEHFTVRSFPPRGLNQVTSLGTAAGPDRPPVKAKRKRIYRIGNQKEQPTTPSDASPPTQTSPAPPSEFDQADMDRYFRSYDDLSIGSHPLLRRRHPR